MTPQSDEVTKALALIDRNQKFLVIASLAGYAVWFVATFVFINMVKQADLPQHVEDLLHFGAVLAMFSAMATQFMICNYITIMTRRVLRAIHLAQRLPNTGGGERS